MPELYDKTVEIFKIVREPGYRTKMAVYSHREDVDPVGACVGLKGVRIQTIVKEMEGEKIDVLKYDPDPRDFIKNALSPAEVESVIILDEAKRQALAVVSENQLSLAIGKQGLNVRLANRLVDWNIDVKTIDQFEEMDISAETKKAVSALFMEDEYDDKSEEITRIEELPGIHERLVELLRQHGIELIEAFLALDAEQLSSLDGITQQDVESIRAIIDENVEIIEENEAAESAYEESEEKPEDRDENADFAQDNTGEEDEDFYECPECGSKITVNMTNCPNCGVGLSFEDEDEDEESEENNIDGDDKQDKK